MTYSTNRRRLTSSQIVAALDLGLQSLAERAPDELQPELRLMLQMTGEFLEGSASGHHSS